MIRESLVNTWEKDPEFVKKPWEEKAKIAVNYFESNATPDYHNLPEPHKDILRKGFLNDNLPKPAAAPQLGWDKDPEYRGLNQGEKRLRLLSHFEQNATPDFHKLPEPHKDILREGFLKDHLSPAASSDAPKGALGAFKEGLKQTGLGLRTAANVYVNDEADVRALSGRMSEIQGTEQQEAFRSDLHSREYDGWTEAAKELADAIVNNPRGAFHEGMAQMPNSAVAMGMGFAGLKTGAAIGSVVPGVGTVIGGIAGGIIGLLAGNVALETGFVAHEKVQGGDYDRGETIRQGGIKGSVITAVDMVTFKATSMMYKAAAEAVSSTLARAGVNIADEAAISAALRGNRDLALQVQKAGGLAAMQHAPAGLTGVKLATASIGLEMAGEGAGDYWGSMAAGLDANKMDALLEAALSMPQSAGMAMAAKGMTAPGKIMGRPETVPSALFDTFQVTPDATSQRTPEIQRTFSELMETVKHTGSGLSEDGDGFLGFAQTGQAGNEKQIQGYQAQISEATTKVESRTPEQNVARGQELIATHRDGKLSEQDAIELTAIIANSPKAEQVQVPTIKQSDQAIAQAQAAMKAAQTQEDVDAAKLQLDEAQAISKQAHEHHDPIDTLNAELQAARDSFDSEAIKAKMQELQEFNESRDVDVKDVADRLINGEAVENVTGEVWQEVTKKMFGSTVQERIQKQLGREFKDIAGITEVFADTSEMPEAALRQAQEAGADINNIDAIYFNGQILINAASPVYRNMNPQALRDKVVHEAFVHMGLDTLGKDRKQEIGESIYKTLSKKEVADIAKRQGIETENHAAIGEEWLAYQAERVMREGKTDTVWAELSKTIRKMLRDLGLNVKYSDLEIAEIVMEGQAGVQHRIATSQQQITELQAEQEQIAQELAEAEAEAKTAENQAKWNDTLESIRQRYKENQAVINSETAKLEALEQRQGAVTKFEPIEPPGITADEDAFIQKEAERLERAKQLLPVEFTEDERRYVEREIKTLQRQTGNLIKQLEYKKEGTPDYKQTETTLHNKARMLAEQIDATRKKSRSEALKDAGADAATIKLIEDLLGDTDIELIPGINAPQAPATQTAVEWGQAGKIDDKTLQNADAIRSTIDAAHRNNPGYDYRVSEDGLYFERRQKPVEATTDVTPAVVAPTERIAPTRATSTDKVAQLEMRIANWQTIVDNTKEGSKEHTQALAKIEKAKNEIAQITAPVKQPATDEWVEADGKYQILDADGELVFEVFQDGDAWTVEKIGESEKPGYATAEEAMAAKAEFQESTLTDDELLKSIEDAEARAAEEREARRKAKDKLIRSTVKQPHEMTQAEFLKETTNRFTGDKQEATGDRLHDRKAIHRAAVEKALDTVTDKVLADYPDLAFARSIQRKGVAKTDGTTVKVTSDEKGFYIEVTGKDNIRQDLTDRYDTLEEARETAIKLYGNIPKDTTPATPVPIPKKDDALTYEKVFNAYKKVQGRDTFKNIEIYKLQQELGVDMDALKSFLLKESQEGRAVLSLGDWSLSTDDVKSGAIEVNGRKNTLVRFKDDLKTSTETPVPTPVKDVTAPPTDTPVPTFNPEHFLKTVSGSVEELRAHHIARLKTDAGKHWPAMKTWLLKHDKLQYNLREAIRAVDTTFSKPKTPKEQKEQLLARIDKATTDASGVDVSDLFDAAVIDNMARATISATKSVEKPTLPQARILAHTEQMKELNNRYGSVDISIPGGATFTITNHKYALKKFKERIQKGFPLTAESKKKSGLPTMKPSTASSQRITGDEMGELTYYNPFTPKTENALLKGEQTFYEDGFYSNGFYAVKTNEKDKTAAFKPNEQLTKMIETLRTDLKTAKPAELFAEFSYDKNVLVHVVSESNDVAISANIADSILTRHPGANVSIGASKIIMFHKDGELVGFSMPYKIDTAEWITGDSSSAVFGDRYRALRIGVHEDGIRPVDNLKAEDVEAVPYDTIRKASLQQRLRQVFTEGHISDTEYNNALNLLKQNKFDDVESIVNIKDNSDESIATKTDESVLDNKKPGLVGDEVGAGPGVVSTEGRSAPGKTGDADAGSSKEVQELRGTEGTGEGTAVIDDFGEKLGGARKDTAHSVLSNRERSDEEMANLTLSEIWPKKEIDAIEDIETASIAAAIRSVIPTKPQKKYKVKQWVDKVRDITNVFANIMNAESRENALVKLRSSGVLQNVVNKIDLYRGIGKEHWDRVGKVDRRSDSYVFDKDNNRQRKPYWFIEVDKRGRSFYGDSLNDILPKVNDALANKVEKGLKFELKYWKNKEDEKYFLIKKGDSLNRPLKTFDTIKEARAFQENNYNDLAAAWEDIKSFDNVGERDVRRAENKPRTGKDHRGGKDVTAEMFQDAFGFRGVEFGNWVSQGTGKKDRQGMLNQAYDALMDLSEIMGVETKALALDGGLGLGFGSRGSGWASAHFETATFVINLTKTRGAGSLAHEWFHAMDNYFHKKITDKKKDTGFITESPWTQYVNMDTGQTMSADVFNRAKMSPEQRQKYKHVDVRPEVSEAFTGLVKALDASPMAGRSTKLSKGVKGYWQKTIERAARSFENYIIAKMQQKGYDNDYLANVISNEEFSNYKNPDFYPYLLQSEMPPIEQAFDNLFDTIKTKETDSGVAMYSIASGIESDARYSMFSQMERTLTKQGMLPKSSTIAGMVEAIKKHVGKFKGVELEESGLLEHIGSIKQGTVVTRQDVVDYLKMNQIRFIEKVKQSDDAIYEGYKTEGVENYREILLRLPATVESVEAGDTFRSSHWREENVLLHLRVGDKGKAYFIEEIQSDWHQAGRKEGYKPSTKEYEKADAEYGKFVKEMKEKYGQNWTYDIMPEEMEREIRLLDQRDRVDPEEVSPHLLPQAPFKKTENWAMLGMKRAIQEAVTEGYDSVEWLEGKEQAERYGLRSKVNRVEISKSTDATTRIKIVFDKRQTPTLTLRIGNDGIITTSRTGDGHKGKSLYKVIGQELADKVMKANDGDVLSDIDIEIGGEGMLGFYDQILPNEVKKYVKKWGANVIRTESAWHFDVTPQMRESVRTEGQPMYSIASPELAKKLEAGEKVKVFRAMQIIDGNLYPPMSAKVKGELREPTQIGRWEQSEENPEYKNKRGKFDLDKANKSSVEAAYNPYFHSSESPLNDQFKSAYKRPNLVTVEAEIPASELTSGYRAEGAKNTVGEHSWNTGPVSSKLPAHKKRTIFLSRYAKVVRIVPDSEVAAYIANLLEGENITIPDHVVTPSLKNELQKLGVMGGEARYSIRESEPSALAENKTGSKHYTAELPGGYLDFEVTPDKRMYMHDAYTDMEARGQGIATKMVDEIIEKYAKDVDEIWGGAASPVMARIFERAGFREEKGDHVPKSVTFEKTTPYRLDTATRYSIAIPEETQILNLPGFIGKGIKGTIKNTFLRTVESATDRLRRSGNPAAVDLAKRVDDYFDSREKRLGFWNGGLEKHLKKVKWRERKPFIKDFEEYWRHHDNGRTADADAVLTGAHSELAPMVATVKRLFHESGQENQRIGIKVWDGKKYRPIGKVTEGEFWPRMFKPDVQRVLRDQDYRLGKGRDLWGKMIQALMDEQKIATPEEAKKYIHGYHSDLIAEDYFAGVEKARGEKLPELFYDYSYDVISKYANKWSARTSQIEHFGQKMDKGTERQEDVFDKISKSQALMREKDHRYIDEIKKTVYQQRDHDIHMTFMDYANIFATATQLGNPATATLNILGGTTLNWQLFGTKYMLGSFKELVRDWKAIQERGAEYGILNKDVMNILNDTERHAGQYLEQSDKIQDFLRSFANATMTWGGYRVTENFIRSQAMVAAEMQLKDALAKWKNNPNSADAAAYRKLMNTNNIDINNLIVENGAGAETAKYLRKMVNIPQGSYRIDQTPVFVDTRLGRFFWKYQKFGTQVSRMFYDNMFRPLAEAKTPGERAKAAHNMIGFFGKAFIGGAFILAARAALFGYKDPGPDEKDLAQAFKNDDTHRAFMLLSSRAFHNMMAASMLGFYGNYINFALDVADRQRPKSPLSPPALSSIHGMQQIVLGYMDQGTLTARDLENALEGQLSIYRGYKRAAASISSSVGIEWKEAQLFEFNKERQYARDVAATFAKEANIETRRQRSGIPVKTPRSPMNQKLFESLATGNHEAARIIMRENMQGLNRKERQNLMQSMRATVAQRQPLNIYGSLSRQERVNFYKWARENLDPGNFNRVRAIDLQYKRAAVKAGLLSQVGFIPQPIQE